MLQGMDEFANRRRIYLLAAHPDLRESRVTRTLLQQARELPGVQVRDLYASYPDFDIDVRAEQAAAAAAQLLVLLHPIRWYSMPALMKLWLEEVLRYGWAYGRSGTALQGKDLWLVASTGGPEGSYRPEGYNGRPFDAFLPPYEQTAALCGMRFLPPLVLHGAHRAAASGLQAHAALFRERLASYPHWPQLAPPATRAAPDVPARDRPATAGG